MQAKEIYDKAAAKWERRTPNILTDFAVRPLVFEWCGKLDGKQVLDLGCGEGYVSRYCKTHGATQVLGIDISEGMIEKAQQQESKQPLGIEYQQKSLTEFIFPENAFDVVLGVFVFNYLTIDETKKVFKNIYQCLKPQGKFIFSLPHPLLPWLIKNSPPTYFDKGKHGYFSGQDAKFPGKVWCLDGTVLDLQMLHKTFADIFACLKEAGFANLPECRELSVTEELLKQAPDIFQPGADIPLHLVVKAEKG